MWCFVSVYTIVHACAHASARVCVCVCEGAPSALFAQMLPLNLSPTSKYTTASTLAMVILFSMVREAFEDMVRHRPCGFKAIRACLIVATHARANCFNSAVSLA